MTSKACSCPSIKPEYYLGGFWTASAITLIVLSILSYVELQSLKKYSIGLITTGSIIDPLRFFAKISYARGLILMIIAISIAKAWGWISN